MRTSFACLQDPEGLFKNSPTSPGLIERKLMGQRTEEDKDSKAAMESFMIAHKEEVQKRREARIVPDDPHDMVEYFLDTEAPDMTYEVARCRPKLDEAFFAVLNKQIGTFASSDYDAWVWQPCFRIMFHANS